MILLDKEFGKELFDKRPINGKILVLGHGKYYKKEDIRCSPIDKDLWFDKEYTSVDNSTYVEPDILYDLYNKKNIIQNWTFSNENEYDIIIDCGGLAFVCSGRPKYLIKNSILIEIYRILKINGIFYTRGGQYHKINKYELEFIYILNNDYYKEIMNFHSFYKFSSNVTKING